MIILRHSLKPILRPLKAIGYAKMSETDVAQSSKRALSRSPARATAETSEPPTKKPALEEDIASRAEPSNGDGKGGATLKPDEEASVNVPPSTSQASSSNDLVGQGRRGYKGKSGARDRREAVDKRSWHQPREGKRESRADKEGSDGEGEKGKRLPKKKVAILLGWALPYGSTNASLTFSRYCGAGYSGMQM